MILRKKLSILKGFLALGLLCGCSEKQHEYDKKSEYSDAQISPTP